MSARPDDRADEPEWARVVETERRLEAEIAAAQRDADARLAQARRDAARAQPDPAQVAAEADAQQAEDQAAHRKVLDRLTEDAERRVRRLGDVPAARVDALARWVLAQALGGEDPKAAP